MNKYLEKIAESIDPEELSGKQLKELFARFKKLPADGQDGQPGEKPFYGSVKLSEGTPGVRETRRGNRDNYLFGREGTSPEEYQFEYQRAFPR